MTHEVINDFRHPHSGDLIKKGSPLPGKLSDDDKQRLTRARCLKPLPAGDTLQGAPAPQAASQPEPQGEEGGKAAGLFPGSDPEAVAGDDDSGDSERAKPQSGGRKRAANKGASHDSGE